jgi:hypothetical protein
MVVYLTSRSVGGGGSQPRRIKKAKKGARNLKKYQVIAGGTRGKGGGYLVS